MKRAVIALVIIAAAGGGAWAYYVRRAGPEIGAVTSPITRGDIVDAVSTTGTLQAVTTVQIGSQVSGNISYLGADFNSIVKRGQIIARLDPSLLQAQVEQSRANVLKSQSDVAQSEANLARARVALLDTQQKYARAQQLDAKGLEPQADLDAAKIAVDSAQSSLQSAQAALNSSKASVGQSQANFNQTQVNLDHTIITSPVDGIVTQRSVDVGQTVAASMQAPTLFIIAVDLTKLQVSANIDEADIGRIRPGQRVTFRVDAYPADNFEGTVAQVRLQPVVVQNVTTYATIIDAPNADLKLRPGMTATLRVEVSQKSDVLRVPAAALRFRRRRTCSKHSISPCRLKYSAAAAAVAAELAAVGVAGRTLRAPVAVLAARRQPHRRGRRTVRPPLRRSRVPASATGKRVAPAAIGGVAAADLVAVVVDLVVVVVADSEAKVDAAAAEDARARRRRPSRAPRRARTRLTRSLHHCPRLNLEVASGRSPTNSSSPWMSVLALPTARSPSSWTAGR